MDFRLYYRGRLKSNGSREDKQALRRELHPQLRALWDQPPLDDQKLLFLNRAGGGAAITLLRPEGAFLFAPLVSAKLGLYAELDVLLLRPQRPGTIVTYGGDIDNRLKTLLDALRVPAADELPGGDMPSDGEDPFYCLLEDDGLITRLAVTTDQLLHSSDPAEVVLVLHVLVKNSGSGRFWSFV